MLRRTAYFIGLLLGSSLTGLLLGAALIYLWTGQVLTWQQGPQGIEIKLHEPNAYHLANREEAS